ncbi:MAG: hypothetical protein C4567_15865, partial [Deltaproteobacteria bacterium]
KNLRGAGKTRFFTPLRYVQNDNQNYLFDGNLVSELFEAANLVFPPNAKGRTQGSPLREIRPE